VNQAFGRQDLRFAATRVKRLHKALDKVKKCAYILAMECDLNGIILHPPAHVFASASGGASARARRRARRLAKAIEIAIARAAELVSISDLASVSGSVNFDTQRDIQSILSILAIFEHSGIFGSLKNESPITSSRTNKTLSMRGVALGTSTVRELVDQVTSNASRAKEMTDSLLERIADNIAEAAAAGPFEARHVAASARWLARFGIWVLPKLERPRQIAEVDGQLWELAGRRFSTFAQIMFAARTVVRAPQLRRALRVPRRRNAVP
jgi:hypothetical protein